MCVTSKKVGAQICALQSLWAASEVCQFKKWAPEHSNWCTHDPERKTCMWLLYIRESFMFNVTCRHHSSVCRIWSRPAAPKSPSWDSCKHFILQLFVRSWGFGRASFIFCLFVRLITANLRQEFSDFQTYWLHKTKLSYQWVEVIDYLITFSFTLVRSSTVALTFSFISSVTVYSLFPSNGQRDILPWTNIVTVSRISHFCPWPCLVSGVWLARCWRENVSDLIVCYV